MITLILASQSPRRQSLLRLLNLPTRCIAANVNEQEITIPNPSKNVIETARLKVQKIADTEFVDPNSWILGADTTVALDDQMLNKPINESDARKMLKALRGRDHFVHTGIVLLNSATEQMIEGAHSATVTMRHYSDSEIDAYIATGDPFDKAGAYAIQHPQFMPVAGLDGCFMGVMGLSVCQLIQLMIHNGIKLELDLTAVYQAHHPFYNCPIFPHI